jgi:group I intron endonuclease
MEYIYIIENSKTGKFYIGRTNDPSARKRCHLSELRRGVHGNPRLQASFNKHGEDAFEFKVVDSATPEMITAKEAEWFSAFDENKNYLYNYSTSAVSIATAYHA